MVSLRALLSVAVAVAALVVPARAAEPVHPELPQTSGDPARPLPVVQVGSRSVYAHGADLLEWNGTAIVARTRLPARIAAIAPRDDRSLTVTLAPRSEFGIARDRVDVLVALEGPRPGRGFWSGGNVDAYLTLREARAVSAGFEPEATGLDPEKRKALLAALTAREAVDRTNAFLPFFRGQVLIRAGERDEALRAFTVAAELERAPFNDLLRLSQMLEDEDVPAIAERAFQRGLALLQAAGLRPERLQSQVAYQVLMGVPRHALSSAFARRDTARVDALEERVAQTFPRLEGAHLAFRDLAAWMRENGRADLAAKWAGRADVAASSVSNMAVSDSLEAILPTIVGMSIVAPLIAFVVGLRRGSRRDDPTRRVFIDVLTALMPLIATIALIAWSNAQLETIARRAYVPIALLDDGAASPDVARFVEQRLAGSPEREQLLLWISSEARATTAGGRYEGPAPDDRTIRSAFARPNVRAAIRDAIGKPSPLTGAERALGFQHTILLSGILFIAGYFIAGRAPRAALAAARVIPGGPESLPIVGPLLGGAFLGAVFSMFIGERVLSSLATPNNARFFGFETIANAHRPVVDRGPAYLVIAAYVVIHLIAVIIDRRRAARSE